MNHEHLSYVRRVGDRSHRNGPRLAIPDPIEKTNGVAGPLRHNRRSAPNADFCGEDHPLFAWLGGLACSIMRYPDSGARRILRSKWHTSPTTDRVG